MLKNGDGISKSLFRKDMVLTSGDEYWYRIKQQAIMQTGKVDVILVNFTVTPEERAEEVDFAPSVSLGNTNWPG